MDQQSGIIAVLSFLLAVVAFVFTMSKRGQDQLGALRTEMMAEVKAVRDQAASEIKSVRENSATELRRVEEVGEKSRHAQANQTTQLIGKLEGEIDRLKRETVRREDMMQIEGRISALIEKIGTRVDMIADKVSGIPQIDNRLGKVEERFERVDEFSGRNSRI